MGRALSRSLAPRSGALGRVRAVAEPGAGDASPRHPDGAGQWPAVGAFVWRAGALARADPADAAAPSTCASPRTRSRPSASARSARAPVASVGDLKAAAAPLAARSGRARRAARVRSARARFGSPPARMPARRRSPPRRIVAICRAHPGLLTIIVPRHPGARRRDRRDAGGERSARCPARARRADHSRDRCLSRRHDGRARAVFPPGRDRLYRRLAGRQRRPQPVRGGAARLRRAARAGYEQLRRDGGCARRPPAPSETVARCARPWRGR